MPEVEYHGPKKGSPHVPDFIHGGLFANQQAAVDDVAAQVPSSRIGLYEFNRKLRDYWDHSESFPPILPDGKIGAEEGSPVHAATLPLGSRYRVDYVPSFGLPFFKLFLVAQEGTSRDLACVKFSPFSPPPYEIATSQELNWPAARPMTDAEETFVQTAAKAVSEKLATVFSLPENAVLSRGINPSFGSIEEDARLLTAVAGAINPTSVANLKETAKIQPTIPLDAEFGLRLVLTGSSDYTHGDVEGGVTLQITRGTIVAGYQTIKFENDSGWTITTDVHEHFRQRGFSTFLTRATTSLSQKIADNTEGREMHAVQSDPTSPFTVARLTRLGWSQSGNWQCPLGEIKHIMNYADDHPQEKTEIYDRLLGGILTHAAGLYEYSHDGRHVMGSPNSGDRLMVWKPAV
ncbi:Uncharacterised protein [uncultured archaeon]|nr:Uncharacterised protein [uncultured archaeon]